MTKTLIAMVFTVICGLSFAQQKAETSSGFVTTVIANYIVIDGTYQVILSDERMLEPELSDAILHEINNVRDEFKTKYIPLDDYTRILILSYTAINAEDFLPLEKYVYED